MCDCPRDRMKRNLYLLLSLLLCLPLSAQQTCRTRVVDSETGEPVSYATVCPSSGSRVMTNAEGDFYMQTVSSDTLYISRIGYESLRIAAAQVGGRIALRPPLKDAEDGDGHPSNHRGNIEKDSPTDEEGIQP